MVAGSCLIIPSGTYCGSAGSGTFVVLDVNGTAYTLLVASGGTVLTQIFGTLAVLSDGSVIFSTSWSPSVNVTAAIYNGGSITVSLSSEGAAAGGASFAFANVQLFTGACSMIPAGQYCGSTLTFSASAVVIGKLINVSVMQNNAGTSQVCNVQYYGVSIGGTFLTIPLSNTCFFSTFAVSWLQAQSSLVLTQSSTNPNLVLSTGLCGAVPPGFYCGRAPYPVTDTEAVIQVTDSGAMNVWIYSSSNVQMYFWPSSLLWQHQLVVDFSSTYGAVKALTFSDGALTLSASPASLSAFKSMVLMTGQCPWISVSAPSASLGFAQTSWSISQSSIRINSVFCSASSSFMGLVTLQNGLVQILPSPPSGDSSSSGETPPCVQQQVLGLPSFFFNSPATSTVVVASTVLNFPGTWVLGSGSATGGAPSPANGAAGGGDSSHSGISAPSFALGMTVALLTVGLFAGGMIFFKRKSFGFLNQSLNAASVNSEAEEPMLAASDRAAGATVTSEETVKQV
jgi:hypothetical protein